MNIDQLQQALKDVLAGACLRPQALPSCPELKLFLLEADYPVDALDTETAVKVMDNPLYWLFCWASGHAMAAKILQQPELVKGKTVLDVGAGSGVVAIAAAMAGASEVIASDIDPVAQQAMIANAELNQVRMQIIGDYREYQGDVDLVLLADVLYDRDNIPLLEALLKRAPLVLLADSRVKNFSYPGLSKIETCPGETFPNLGGFDEFFEVNIYRSC